MKIFKCKTQKEFLDNVLVRGKVFIVEQEIDWELEFDGLDDRCSLYIAYEGEEPVGAARLYKNKVGRVATLKEYRKKGVGIVKGTIVEHLAPPYENVPFQMKDLFEYLSDSEELELIICGSQILDFIELEK